MMQICDLNQGRMSSIVCHKRELVYMDLDPSGQKAATAGVLGTIIRIWNLKDEKLLYELRRGADPAIIYSFSFASLGSIASSKLLIASSNKGTCHIWKTSGDSNVTNNSKKIASDARKMNSDRHVDNIYTDIANFVQQGKNERRSVCSFATEPDEANIVRLVFNRQVQEMQENNLASQKNAPNPNHPSVNMNLSSNLCAIMVTKGGQYYKFHVDTNKQLCSKLLKENLMEDSFSSNFS